MPQKLTVPADIKAVVAKPLTREGFASFGTVIQNPMIDRMTTRAMPLEVAAQSERSIGAQLVNQETNIKYANLAELVNRYRQAPSQARGRAVMHMLVGEPQEFKIEHGQHELDGGTKATGEVRSRDFLSVRTLERHPFTGQTFIPLGDSGASHSSHYLIVVAPTLPVPSTRKIRPPPFPMAEPRRRRSLKDVLSEARPPPFPQPAPHRRRSLRDMILQARPPPFPERGARPARITPQKSRLPGSGLPDLHSLKAFVATVSQAVIFGPGVWHGPIMVVGEKPIEFVVIQFSNGVAAEDTQEIQLDSSPDQGMSVAIPSSVNPNGGLSTMKAKL